MVVPVRDRRDLLSGTLSALGSQTYAELEVIVVDDGSTDDTPGALSQLAGHPRLRIVRKVVNEGKAMALNDALPLARGEIVLILDADAEPGAGAGAENGMYRGDTPSPCAYASGDTIACGSFGTEIFIGFGIGTTCPCPPCPCPCPPNPCP